MLDRVQVSGEHVIVSDPVVITSSQTFLYIGQNRGRGGRHNGAQIRLPHKEGLGGCQEVVVVMEEGVIVKA
jgi:hypothetical protein